MSCWGFLPLNERVHQERLSGGGFLGAGYKAVLEEEEKRNSSSTAPGKCRRAEQAPAGLGNSYLQGEKPGPIIEIPGWEFSHLTGY